MKSIQELFDVEKPVAFVTGSGAPRVGNAIAWRLARRGFRIVLHCNSSIANAEQTAAEMAAEGTEVLIVRGPIDDQVAVDQIFREIDQRFGRIDVLVNSAAIWSPKRFEDVTADDVRKNLEVNTLGTFIASQAAGLRMVDQTRGGVIVNIGDWAVVRPYVDYAAYFPSKGAIPTMTRSLAVELAQRNRFIRVNAILPGPVLLGSDVSTEVEEANRESTLLKRVGTAEHVAHAVEFLVENDFVTGICLNVDGGRAIYAGDPMQVDHRTD
ncbi:Glucose 1-dehydrogenase 2 [Rosistilla carotiformis]|uniref:Glucose 1-dehydrogenase 2 n=1 Tax=Rosistilla carotiformis TaxID=2528017 RepID=A0A518JZF0_9BACT|nr:SDR family oxidoreductase [Rosistilla carotiformis]QDV70926.1 Glucose 1-dehydrogenase 2 [Rosistilla carotiformis]